MKDFFKFAITGIFFKGFRKFITMGAAIYLLMNIQGEVGVNESAEKDKNEVTFLEKSIANFRLPANFDSLNLKSINSTKAKFVKKEKDFKSFGGNSNGLASAVNEKISQSEKKRNRRKKEKQNNLNPLSSIKPKVDTADLTNAGQDSSSTLPTVFGGTSFPQGTLGPEDTIVSETPDTVVPRQESNNRSITCSSDRSEGLFASSISLILSCSETATIQYCVQQGGGCCDPFSNPTNFSGSLDLNTGDGDYCVSFYGSSLDGTLSEVSSLSYQIDSTLPDLVVNFALTQVQSTELPFVNETQSSDFGKANHFYHQINLRDHDPGPAGLNLTCSEIFNTYNTIASPSPIAIETNLDTSGNLPTDQITQTVDSANLFTGVNHIVTIFEDRTRNVFSCQTQRVLLEDVVKSDFTGTGSTPVFTGVRRTAGGFVAFGHYQATPGVSVAGASENEQAGTINKSDLLNVIY